MRESGIIAWVVVFVLLFALSRGAPIFIGLGGLAVFSFGGTGHLFQQYLQKHIVSLFRQLYQRFPFLLLLVIYLLRVAHLKDWLSYFNLYLDGYQEDSRYSCSFVWIFTALTEWIGVTILALGGLFCLY